MAKTISMNKVRRAISVAYQVSIDNIPETLEDQFITYRKAA